jgi:membrane protein implicated in regulation of membrane protease activity
MACGVPGFSPRWTCKLPEGHVGSHRYDFVADKVERKVESVKGTSWLVEETHRKGVFDVFIDRRAGAYDLDLQGAISFVQNHRSFKKGDQVSVIDQTGVPVQVS